MHRPINNKQWNYIPLVILAVVSLFAAVFSVRAGVADSGQIERRVNVPYLGTGPEKVLAFEPTIFWFGQVTPTINSTDVRLWYYDDYVKIVLNTIDRRLWYNTTATVATLEDYDAATLFLSLDGNLGSSPSANSYRFVSQLNAWQADADYQAAFKGNGSSWVEAPVPFTTETTWRGDALNNDNDDKGWMVTYVIPFSSLGLAGRPNEGTKWGLAVSVHDRDEADGNPAIADQVWPELMDAGNPSTWGVMNFGMPVYNPPAVAPQGTTTIRNGLNGATVVDGHVGGHTTCGDSLDHWTEWGLENYAGYSQFNIQNQWDVSDYPCFSKYYVTFPLNAVPAGKSILEAKLTMYRFGNAGGGDYSLPLDSFINVLTVAEDWDEQTLNWNNAPLALENYGGTWVPPVQTSTQYTFDWDVSRAVAEAYGKGEPLRLAMYSIDGDMHSGKYFFASEMATDVAPTLNIVWGEGSTNTPVPPTSTASASGSQQQDIPLNAGWNMISSYLQPENTAVAAVFADIANDLVLVKNDAGEVYWPSQGVDTIVNWDIREGYQVQMSNPATLRITGTAVDAVASPIDLPQGWSMVSYLSSVSQPVEEAMASILDEVLLLKNAQGDVYWPELGVNEIVSLLPGQGYKIYLANGATLTYPAVPTPTSTPVPPTNTPVAPTSTPLPPGSGNQYFISPTGSDGKSGTSTSEAWATFDHAWSVLEPGDTLTLMDGVYYQSIMPNIRGIAGNPITIRAQNDGKAIIDGQGVRNPVDLKGWLTSYLVIEGIVAKNGVNASLYIDGSYNNVLRRVSGYNADTDRNSTAIGINNGDNNLIEDCVAAGTGRKMIIVFKGESNTIRRCLADWREWDGREWHDCWPWGEGIELYNASNNVIENSIAYGNTPRGAFSLLAQGGDASSGNKILGSMAIQGGMQHDSTPMVWGDTRPQPTDYTCVASIYEWPGYMSGFDVAVSGGILLDNLMQDILSWGNARYGLSVHTDRPLAVNNNNVNRATVFNNGLVNDLTPTNYGPVGAGAGVSDLEWFSSINNSIIENIWTGTDFTSMSGEGARLSNRYIDGVLTNEPLWPWPMEDRVQAELGYSVTDVMTGIIAQSP